MHFGLCSSLQTRDKQLLPPTKGDQKIDIKRSGAQPSSKGPTEYFTGTVRIDPLFQANDPVCALGVSVTFEPGARTAWHTRPLGQTLIVTAGGLAQGVRDPTVLQDGMIVRLGEVEFVFKRVSLG